MMEFMKMEDVLVGKMKGIVDYSLIEPSDCTAKIQGSHIMIGHIICGVVENYFVGNKKDNCESL